MPSARILLRPMTTGRDEHLARGHPWCPPDRRAPDPGAVEIAVAEEDGSALHLVGGVHQRAVHGDVSSMLTEPDEMTVMRTHAARRHEMLPASGMTDPVALMATRHHHEMLDGSGYPDGLRGDAIADPVRPLTICDIYAALTERRSYRPPMAQVSAVRNLRGMAGHGLEPALIEAFAASLAGDEAPPTPAGRPDITDERTSQAIPPRTEVDRSDGRTGSREKRRDPAA